MGTCVERYDFDAVSSGKVRLGDQRDDAGVESCFWFITWLLDHELKHMLKRVVAFLAEFDPFLTIYGFTSSGVGSFQLIRDILKRVATERLRCVERQLEDFLKRIGFFIRFGQFYRLWQLCRLCVLTAEEVHKLDDLAAFVVLPRRVSRIQDVHSSILNLAVVCSSSSLSRFLNLEAYLEVSEYVWVIRQVYFDSTCV